MLITTYIVWGHTPRPWGYEVRADYIDSQGAIYNECLTFESQPDDAAIAAAVETRRTLVENRLIASEEAANAEEVLGV